MYIKSDLYIISNQCRKKTWKILTVNSYLFSTDLKQQYTSEELLLTDLPRTILYTNIDLKLQNKSHGPMHYKTGVTCVYNGHVFYTRL